MVRTEKVQNIESSFPNDKADFFHRKGKVKNAFK